MKWIYIGSQCHKKQSIRQDDKPLSPLHYPPDQSTQAADTSREWSLMKVLRNDFLVNLLLLCLSSSFDLLSNLAENVWCPCQEAHMVGTFNLFGNCQLVHRGLRCETIGVWLDSDRLWSYNCTVDNIFDFFFLRPPISRRLPSLIAI
jgi:hypothetical protein